MSNINAQASGAGLRACDWVAAVPEMQAVGLRYRKMPASCQRSVMSCALMKMQAIGLRYCGPCRRR